MSLLTHFTTIEDAFYYLFQAKGTPDTTQGSAIKQRHLRTAILLGWVGVDDALAAFAVRENLSWPPDCRRRALLPRLRFVWNLLDTAALDEAEFNQKRTIRNRIVHPDGASDVLTTVEQADEALTYCKRLIRVMYPHLVVGEEWKGRLSEFP
jgi:hypothetical protein